MIGGGPLTLALVGLWRRRRPPPPGAAVVSGGAPPAPALVAYGGVPGGREPHP